MPDMCPVCGSRYLKYFGAGTEKVEEVASKMFPHAAVARLDFDTAAKKGSVNKILGNFKKGKTDILIGTQMVAKGLDFDNVDLVGIVAADVSLNIPDFRSGERTFQLITQVAGRAGRGDLRGEVIIQTYMPDNYAVKYASEHDYQSFYEDEILLRKTLGYPPFSDIIRVTVSADSETFTRECADQVKSEIMHLVRDGTAGKAESDVLGPNPAPVLKVKDEFRYYIYIKSPGKMKNIYEDILSKLKKEINTDKKKGFRVIMEVNPFTIY